jgi:hypothetical protein
MWSELGHNLPSEPGETGSEGGKSVEAFVRLHRPEFMKGTHARYGTVFTVDPADFGCPPCFEDFDKVLGNLILLAGPEAGRQILLLIRQGDGGAWSDSTAVRRWADIQGFDVPLLMVPEATYRSFALRKTGVIVVDGSIQRVWANEIPMEHNAHAELWSRMKERDRVENP